MPAKYSWRRRPDRRPVVDGTAKREFALRPRFRPRLDELEDRTLLSYNLSDVISAYNTGVSAVGTASAAAAVVDQVLGTNVLPMANQTLDQGLGLAADFLRPFQTVLNQAATDWNTVASALQSAGFSIPVPFTGAPDAHNNLLEVTWIQALAPTDPIQILGQTGFLVPRRRGRWSGRRNHSQRFGDRHPDVRRRRPQRELAAAPARLLHRPRERRSGDAVRLDGREWAERVHRHRRPGERQCVRIGRSDV